MAHLFSSRPRVIPTLQEQPPPRLDFPLQLFSLLFGFHWLSGSFLRLGFSDIYTIFSIGSIVTFPKTRTFFWLVESGRGNSRPFFGPLRKENVMKNIEMVF